jgi:hypothetical protein
LGRSTTFSIRGGPVGNVRSRSVGRTAAAASVTSRIAAIRVAA